MSEAKRWVGAIDRQATKVDPFVDGEAKGSKEKRHHFQ